MTDVLPTHATAPGRVRAVLRADGRVLLLYLVARGVSAVTLLTVLVVATHRGWTYGGPRVVTGLATFGALWDSHWYERIATSGYPSVLPTDGDGTVLQNAWAFMPVFPMLVGLVTALTGWSWPVAGVAVASIAGAGASVLLHRLLLVVGSPVQARWAVVFFAFGPMAFVLQVAYAESTFLLLLFAALLAMARHRYALVATFGCVAAFVRPGALAIALALALHVVVRWRGRQRRAFPIRERVTACIAGVAVAAAGLAWPFVAAAATGRADAYLATETAWWSNTVDDPTFVPLTPWFLVALRVAGTPGVLLLAVGLVAAGWWFARPAARRLGSVVNGFTWSYGLYLVAVFLPQQSLPRLFLPLAAAGADERLTRTRARRWSVLAACIVLQPLAVVGLWLRGAP